MRHLVITQKGRIFGVVRVNTGLRRGLEGARTGATLGDVANRNFTVVSEDDVVFDVIRRMSRRDATMAVVIHGRGVPRASDVVGMISKEHVADSVAASYPRRDRSPT
jgi:CIC family chloride channel protein